MRYNAVFPRSEQGTGFQWFDSSQHHGNPLKSSGFFRFLAFVAYLYEKECNFFQPFGPRFRLMDKTAPEAGMLNL